ncbi:MAG: hypothetical protein JO336_03390 [Acidobacteriia bacterium]|nr:hypothetical protein [Terriglobia bacterium]MBV8902444.1 hypothetical protein [Terriglobia bacterium]MBV9743833.1 hypothetical protein [Terriglobia bacterium]
MGGATFGGIPTSCDTAVREPLQWISLAYVLLSVLIAVHVLKKRGQTHVGCQLAFLAAFWIIYLAGPLVYLVPGYCGPSPEFEVPGALVCLYGLAGFAVGSVFLSKLFRIRPLKDAGPAVAVPSGLRNKLLILGMTFLVCTRLGAVLPGLQSIFSGGQQLMGVAAVLNIWEAARLKEYRKVVLWTGLSFIFPLETIVNEGFFSFGLLLQAPVLVFAATCIGKRNYFRVGVFSMVGIYLGLSLFVTYFRDREEIRALSGGRMSSRLERVTQTFENFELFSIQKPKHLDPISGRLNQALFVGAGVSYMQTTQGWAHGSTLVTAALHIVPRILWKDKPWSGGSSLLTQYTGLVFSEGTTFAMGQVLELYVNFGPWMVFFGYVVMGALVARMDVAGSNALKTGNFQTFLYCFLIAQAIQNVGNDFIFSTGNSATGIVLVYGLQMFMRLKSRRLAASGHQPYHSPTHWPPSAPGYVDRYTPTSY